MGSDFFGGSELMGEASNEVSQLFVFQVWCICAGEVSWLLTQASERSHGSTLAIFVRKKADVVNPRLIQVQVLELTKPSEHFIN